MENKTAKSTYIDRMPDECAYMEAPCRCDCGEWFDLDDGYRSHYRNDTRIICRSCFKAEEDFHVGDAIEYCYVNEDGYQDREGEVYKVSDKGVHAALGKWKVIFYFKPTDRKQHTIHAIKKLYI